MLVRSVHPTSFAKGLLVPGDVLLAFDGVDVASGERAGRQMGLRGCRAAQQRGGTKQGREEKSSVSKAELATGQQPAASAPLRPTHPPPAHARPQTARCPS